MSYQRIKDKFSGDKGEKLKVIAKVIYNLAETGVAIYNIVTALNNEAVCSKFQTFTTNSGGDCSQNLCTYWADQSMNYESLQTNGCYLSQQQGYVQIDSIYDSNASYTLIAFQSVVGLLLVSDYCFKNAKRRLRLHLLFIQLFFTYFNVMAMFLVTNINCGGICAVIANSDRLDDSLKYASVPFASMVFFIIFIFAKCCSENESCLTCFMILAALTGIVGINISSAYLLYQDYSIAGFEIPFKIMIVFLMLKSLYSIYQIYATRKEGEF